MSVNLIASRYANSLLDLSVEENKLEQIHDDFQGLKTALESRDLYLMLKSPIINASKKAQILKTLFDGKVDKMTMSFIDIVARKGRENILPEIITNFLESYKLRKKVSSVKVISAEALSADVIANIKKELAASNVANSEIDLEMEIDPTLVGGFVLQIGDKLYDASVAHQLNKLRKTFSDTSSIN